MRWRPRAGNCSRDTGLPRNRRRFAADGRSRLKGNRVQDLGSRILLNMRVQVLFFGALKEVFGGESERLELREGARVEDLRALFEERAAGKRQLMQSIAIAVNREYAKGEDVLREGDEVALLPPVSGGL